ncbi:MAG TPA: CRISPR-associated endonuclease Cas2 [Holophagaceae bacterium]|nr:CRISPR-associated endonuclease Cas2 [Holophagaceae bacterium]
MACYIITYDLKEGGQYEPLYEAIKSYKTWAHIQESVWAVVSNNKASQIRDHLSSFIDPKDRIFVIRSGSEAAWRNAICRSEWLKERL